MARDAQETQRRILGAALHEFSAKGIAGARVDAIAERARVNKRMLYYYFGSKEGLFRAVLAQRLAETAETPRAPRLADRFAAPTPPRPSTRDYVRLSMWEALQRDPRRPVDAEELRAASLRERVEGIRAEQEQGSLDPALDPAQLAMLELALTMFPVAFPQLTRLVTGSAPDSAEGESARRRFLAQLAARLAAPVDATVA